MATSLRKTLFSNALLAAAALGLGSGLANAQTVGLLSMVKGDVQIARAGQSAPAPAKIADLLAAGDRVLTGANGEATFLFCPESRAGKLLPGGEVEFTAAALQVKKGKLGDERKVPNCKLPAALLAGNSKQQSGMLRLRGSALVLRTPTRSNVADLKPSFRWDKYENATSYEVKLTDREERILWKKNVTTTELAYPSDAPALEPGQKYNWRVVAFENAENQADVGTSFSVLPAATATQVKESEAGLQALAKASPDDNGPLFLLAFLYEDNGMLDSAARVYAQLKTRMGDQDWVQGRLNELMGKLGWDRLESGEAK
jgi:hypothetical protein